MTMYCKASKCSSFAKHESKMHTTHHASLRPCGLAARDDELMDSLQLSCSRICLSILAQGLFFMVALSPRLSKGAVQEPGCFGKGDTALTSKLYSGAPLWAVRGHRQICIIMVCASSCPTPSPSGLSQVSLSNNFLPTYLCLSSHFPESRTLISILNARFLSSRSVQGTELLDCWPH